MSEAEISRICTKSGGDGNMGKLKNGKKRQFKFHHLLDCPKQIMLWKKGPVFKINQVKKMIENAKDTQQI